MPRTIAAGADIVVESEIKRSRFIAVLRRVRTENEAATVLAEQRAQYPDARHHCSAWVIGADPVARIARASDDGEPGGTAGTPMLGVLQGRGLVDVAAVVTRYFGGVKLGAGGLVRAYSGAVAAAVDAAPLIPLTRQGMFEVAVSHADAGRVEAELRGRGVSVLGTDYGREAVLRVAASDPDELASTVASLTSGRSVPERVGERWVEG